jgi:hypothetical protein
MNLLVAVMSKVFRVSGQEEVWRKDLQDDLIITVFAYTQGTHFPILLVIMSGIDTASASNLTH